MKRIIIILCVIWSACSSAQPPTVLGYQTINNKFVYLGIGASALNVPAGGSAAFATSQWVRSGALYYDSTGTDTGLYVSHGTKWIKIGGGSFDSLLISSTGEPNYYFRHRLSGLGFPVATVKPTASGNMAFDIMPFGTPGNYSDNGIAWIDVCDANVVGASTGAVVTARAGVTNTAVQLGMRAFGGASEKRLNIIMGTDSIMTFNTDRTIDVNTADFSISKNTSGNNIQWLINPNTGNSASIWIIAQDFGANKSAFIRYENEGQTGGSPYQQPNQVEFVTNTGATNGMVLGTLLSTAPTKIVAGSTERLRFSADSILWKTPQRVASTTWLLAYDSTTKNMSYIRKDVTFNASEYTPTATNVSNVASATARVTNYMRDGAYVHVQGYVTVTPTAGSSFTSVSITLPIASAMGLATDLNGEGAATTGSAAAPVFVSADTGADVANVNFYSLSTGAHDVYFTFMYKIK